ncbi:flavin-dependent oxidoreductase [Kibdelosporangium aridum]|uniref:Flavin-dependent oxidoreductase n=1 Tax=Kibdelosporangium aridum TaxID=2030 RepID=A0A428Z4N9_KIBAR|nr:LLM class flavin-dependent oxidoreductase [Kibdelosporangium aridum]RSM81611.1 flavin-dependent oxidoreductase [Kibdelosporangium aridum]
MLAGLNFLPTLGPDEMPADRFYAECLELCEVADDLGFSHVKAVEHHFHEWGGYSPDPVVFLTAVAARTRNVRLVTGAVVPAFQHPVKLASSLSVLDNISGGRLDAGFGRAFLPSEFAAFDIPMSESRDRMQEGVTAVERLWHDEQFRWEGKFHQFGPLPRMLPRPVQQPGPPVFMAATVSPESFQWAGERGYHLMIIPIVASHQRLVELLEVHRAARVEAGHPPQGRVHVSYHCYVAESGTEARQRAEEHFEHYKTKQLEAYGSWRGVKSDQYPGYEKMEEATRRTTFTDLLDAGNVVVGDVDEVTKAMLRIGELYPGAEVSLQVRFGDVTHEEALRSVRLIGREVLPSLRSA